MWVDDLAGLLTHLEVKKPFIVGRSRTSRVALRYALRYPARVLGLGLWGLSGGDIALRRLDNYYFGQYLRACQTGGMTAVCDQDHFAGLSVTNPERRNALMDIKPVDFITTLNCWRSMFRVNADQPVMGFKDRELRAIGVPTEIIPYYDAMHLQIAANHALHEIKESQLFDFDPAAWGRQETPEAPEKVAAILCDFIRQLHM